MSIRAQYADIWDWHSHRWNNTIPVAQWLAEYVQWNPNIQVDVRSHPGYLIRLTSPNVYVHTSDCWVTAWCRANVAQHENGTAAFCLVMVQRHDGMVINHRSGDGLVVQIMFDRESDAALFKLSFMDKISPWISTRN